MPRFLSPIRVPEEFVTGNETISGIQTILGATSGKDSYWTEVTIQSGLSANYANFFTSVSAQNIYAYTAVPGTSSRQLATTAFVQESLKSGSVILNNILTTVSSNSAKWDSAYTILNSNSSSYVTLTGEQILKNKTIIDWMTLVRGYNTTPMLCATLVAGEVYTYIYTSSPSNITYYRYIATDGSADSFYTYFSGNTLSGLVASKSITL